MTGVALRTGRRVRQPALFDARPLGKLLPESPRITWARPICARCEENEARYGFRDGGRFDRPRSYCFDCFRLELERRRTLSLVRPGESPDQPASLTEKLADTERRRRRAQIAARRALGV